MKAIANSTQTRRQTRRRRHQSKLYNEATKQRAENINVYAAALQVVSLFLTSTHPDGAFFVYLEEIDENGKVTYVTEGELRALHRRVSNDPNPTKLPVPYHSFLKKDAMPLKPGEVAELRFSLQPISVLVKKGHRLRVVIAGQEKDTFIRIPAEGTPTISMIRNTRGLSRIELPLVRS